MKPRITPLWLLSAVLLLAGLAAGFVLNSATGDLIRSVLIIAAIVVLLINWWQMRRGRTR
jgi:protein-S-isoprenylcysteine O-methyltransferase Ste14